MSLTINSAFSLPKLLITLLKLATLERIVFISIYPTTSSSLNLTLTQPNLYVTTIVIGIIKQLSNSTKER